MKLMTYAKSIPVTNISTITDPSTPRSDSSAISLTYTGTVTVNVPPENPSQNKFYVL